MCQPNTWSPKLQATVQSGAAVYDLVPAGMKLKHVYKITWTVQVAKNVTSGSTLEMGLGFPQHLHLHAPRGVREVRADAVGLSVGRLYVI